MNVINEKIDGQVLKFKNFNFKLAIVEELMYAQKILKPEFDVYKFAESYTKREIDIDYEGYEIIPEVKEYFQNLEIAARLAPRVEKLFLDGGNNIYLELCPFWSGWEEFFTITTIDEDELKQFPNLKRIEANALFEPDDETKTLLEKYHVELVY